MQFLQLKHAIYISPKRGAVGNNEDGIIRMLVEPIQNTGVRASRLALDIRIRKPPLKELKTGLTVLSQQEVKVVLWRSCG